MSYIVNIIGYYTKIYQKEIKLDLKKFYYSSFFLLYFFLGDIAISISVMYKMHYASIN